MNHQYTLSIIKPDAVKRNITGQVNQRSWPSVADPYFEKSGLKIVAQKMTVLTKEQAENFYGEHKARPFLTVR